jgi:hypothetical protein
VQAEGGVVGLSSGELRESKGGDGIEDQGHGGRGRGCGLGENQDGGDHGEIDR